MIRKEDITTALGDKYNIKFKDYRSSVHPDHYFRCIKEMFVYEFPNTKCLVRYKYESPDKENPEVSRIIVIGTTDLKEFMKSRNYRDWIKYKIGPALNIAYNYEPISSNSVNIYSCCDVKNSDELRNLTELIGIGNRYYQHEIEEILRDKKAANISELIIRGQELELEEFIRKLETALEGVDYADMVFAEISRRASELFPDKQRPGYYETIYGEVTASIIV